MNEDAQQAQGEVHLPRWLEDFLAQKFSDSCPAHSKERNIYCINCKLSACKHCMSSGSHEDHRILRIYKNNYRDGVCLAAMKTYIDCSQIQSFKCNNLRVLNRSPRCGSTLDYAKSCNNGSRKSKEAKAYQYCSITCMVKAARKSSIPPIASIQAPPCQESPGEICVPSKRKRKRKGIPHRAPLF
ncbi:hypothetical protein P8452_44071 [Trifolium repens]|nr:hypothetical protein P8452_44071 [Trifolium repens]